MYEHPRIYHKYTENQQSQIAKNVMNSEQNVRMISLDLHGNISDPRFAVVWLHLGGHATVVRYQPCDNLVNAKDWN